MPEADPLRALLGAGAARLQAAGIPAPAREATRLWADLAGLPNWALPPGAPPPSAAESARFREAVERRARGEPLPYVTGVAGFRRLTLLADRRALIPRPETEGLVDLALARVPGGRIADVGTGTGCLALALADEGGYALVVAVDRAPEALALAAANRDRTGLPVRLLQGDLLSGFGPGTLDGVVSNPPYLTEAEYTELEPAVQAHEPRAALVSGTDGLGHSGELLAQAARVLRPGGWALLEIDATRGAATAALARAAGLVDVTVQDDLYGRARYLLARRSEQR